MDDTDWLDVDEQRSREVQQWVDDVGRAMEREQDGQIGWNVELEMDGDDDVHDVDEQADIDEQNGWYNDILFAGPQNNFNDDDVYPYADYDSGVEMYEGDNDIDWHRDWNDEAEDWDAELGD